MPTSIAYFNGQYVPHSEVSIALTDAGFTWGATVVDRTRTYSGIPFRLQEHLERFQRSCEACWVPMTLSVAELVQVSNRVLEAQREAQPDRDVMLVMFATPGNGPQPTLCLHTAEIDIERDRELVQSGAHLVTPTTRHIPDDCVPRSAKMRSRMAWWIAERQVRTYHPTAGALLLDHDGAVLETAHSNFLIVREGAVFSPPRASILPGISLKVVSELCAALGIAFHDQKVTVAECLSADEALLTGTSFGVVGVSQLNERPIPWPGPVLKSLTHAWNALVGVDIHRDYDR